MKLTAFRAATDNDRNMLPKWANVDAGRAKPTACFRKCTTAAEDGSRIIVDGSLAGVLRYPFFRYTLEIMVTEDGEILFDVDGNVREDTCICQGLALRRSCQSSSEFEYYGNGPYESYCDLCHASSVALQKQCRCRICQGTSARRNTEPQQTRMLRIGGCSSLRRRIRVQCLQVRHDGFTQGKPY